MVIALFKRKRSVASHRAGGNRSRAPELFSSSRMHAEARAYLRQAEERAFRGKALRSSNDRTFQASGFYGDFS